MNKKYIMFIDETGNYQIDSEEPFAIIGIIMEHQYSYDRTDLKTCELTNKINQFKQDCFGTTDITLHLNDILRGKGDFKNFSNAQRKKFFEKLPDFLSKINCKIISVTIDKQKLKTYFDPSKDPYVVAFTDLLQNYYSFISKNNVSSARIVLESRDDASNLIIQKAFFDVFNNGTTHLNISQELRDKTNGFIIAKKGDETYKSGLEIADILCNPISRVRRGLIELNPKKIGPYGKENKVFSAIKDKIYTGTGYDDIRNWGFKKVPTVKRKKIWCDNPKTID